MGRAQDLANELREFLLPGCERIEIAGSIRRGKPDPKDIELVAIPRYAPAPIIDLFGNTGLNGENLLDNRIDLLRFAGQWDFDHVLKRAGPKYKRLRHIESDICCDLFVVTAESWGVQFTIRTGPGDFSKELMTRAIRRGMKVDEGRLYRVHNDGKSEVLETPEEIHFFDWLGLVYIEPSDRTVKAIWTQGEKK